MASLYNDLLAVQAIRGDVEATKKLLQTHPLAALKSEIIGRGYFADRNEFWFSIAEEFARLSINDKSDTGWGDLFLQPPRWTDIPARIREVSDFGLAAAGMRALRVGNREEALNKLTEAGLKRISYLQDAYRRSQFSAPLANWTDRTFLQLALGANTAEGATPNYDFILAAHNLLSRTLQSSADDTLTIQAIQDSDERRRVAQTYQTIESQRGSWERRSLERLHERLWSGQKVDEKSITQERSAILNTASDFIVKRRELRATLLTGEVDGSIASLTTVPVLQKLLRPDEVIVLQLAVLGRILRVCVTPDKVLSSRDPLDAQVVRGDASVLQAALTASHEPSVEADSRYPVAEAVRMRNLLFGGLEDCLRVGRRIYLVGIDPLISGVPPAALLEEAPPAFGSGYDLKSAKWLIRTHSFVQISSLNALVATKRLSSIRSGSFDYLGVGNPVLAQPDSLGRPLGELVARGSLNTRSGTLSSLQELPESAVELERVRALYDLGRARILLGEAASEEGFRLQPLSEFDVIHFATHGLVREEIQGLTEPALVLTPKADGDAFSDGILTSSEIAALPLRARLVVLSACNSARYDAQVISSGIQGLSAAFAIAGVPSVVASLWPLESGTAKDLMIGFFKAARSTANIPIADALAVAVRERLEGNTARPLVHPRFWAALVVVGDGAIELGPRQELPERLLGAYSDFGQTDTTELGSAASIGPDVVVGGLGAWNGEKFASLVQRRAINGEKRWEVKDFRNSGAHIATMGNDIFVGGYRYSKEGTTGKSTPVMRKITKDGRVLWERTFADGAKGLVIDLKAAGDGTLLTLMGPFEDPVDESTRFTLLKLSSDGTPISSADTLPAADKQGARYRTGYVAVGDKTVLVALNRSATLATDRNEIRVNSVGLVKFCLKADEAELVLLDMGNLTVRGRAKVKNFRLAQAVQVGDVWLLAGDLRTGCGPETTAAVIVLRKDYSMGMIWSDRTPFETTARGLRVGKTALEVYGTSKRSVTIQDRTVAEKNGADYDHRDYGKLFASFRYGDETQISREIFAVSLNPDGTEQRRDFLGAGLPLEVFGILENGSRLVAYGVAGLRAMWMSR